MEKEQALDRMAETVRLSKLEDAEKAELLELLGKLKGELDALSKTDRADAGSLAGLAQVSTSEAIRENPRPEVLEPSLDAMRGLVKSFEVSHPSLVRVVNSISMMLSDIGI
jgi:hypothetical protein